MSRDTEQPYMATAENMYLVFVAYAEKFAQATCQSLNAATPIAWGEDILRFTSVTICGETFPMQFGTICEDPTKTDTTNPAAGLR